MSNLKIEVLPFFWKDWKQVHKKHRGQEYSSIYSDEEFESCNDETRVESISVLNALKNAIINSISQNCLEGQAPSYDRQPFLSQGWRIHKKRWATDSSGKSGGLRLIFCLNGDHLLLVYIATKGDCADERLLEKVFMTRLKGFLS